jgi:hypothetical protein
VIPGEAAQELYLRLAIASDLHAYAEVKDAPAPSHLRIAIAEGEPGKNPITGLQQLFSLESIRANILLCPGDICHQAQPTALQHAWLSLHKLREELLAERLVATVGNHDLDSRQHSNDYDALEYIKNISPPFPLADGMLNDKFWARHFAIIDGENYRIVVLNSSAYHGSSGEREHGRVAEVTLHKIREELLNEAPKPVNILLCHHHPQQHMEIKLGDYDVMKNGQLLIDTLGSGDLGRWLIVHGHKHHPKLSYASGGGISPLVFSAGSLCASLYPELQSRARNQFHLVTIPIARIPALGLVGTVESWDWASGEGWARAGTTSGLPAICGFGYRGDPILLAQRVAAQVPQDVKNWSDVRANIPEVDYLIPQDFAAMRLALRTLHGLEIQDLHGRPQQIGRFT